MTPVIISGGSGQRLWPVSRASYPKQFCEFYDKSFLRESFERLRPFGEPYIVTVDSMSSITMRTISEVGGKVDQIIYEPYGKNTAPAVALLCHVLEQKGKKDEVVGIFPADHLIADQSAFEKALKLGIECAEKGEVVTLGITPRYPATGYGYVEILEEVYKEGHGLKSFRVKGFCEKPDSDTAKKFFESGKHHWNAGIFVFKVDRMIECFEKYMPEMWKKIESIKADLSNAKIVYSSLEPISIDYGIMEKLDDQVCVPCSIGWSDVGSWDELARLAEEFPNLRIDSQASVFSKDSRSNYVFSIQDKVIGLIGLEKTIVVDTPDALLVCKKGHSQKVKDLLQEIKEAGMPEATEHPFELRPWGKFEILSDDSAYKAKKITVEPGNKLSYQSHEKRDEHWVIIKGQAEVVLDDKTHRLTAGQYIHIPRAAKHRIGNTGKEPMVFVEVQTGTYFGEDDIKRFEDDYNRA